MHSPDSKSSVQGNGGNAGMSNEIMEGEKKFLLRTYARTPVVLSSGKGCKLYDVNGREYLDLSSEIAVNALGHGILIGCGQLSSSQISSPMSAIFISLFHRFESFFLVPFLSLNSIDIIFFDIIEI